MKVQIIYTSDSHSNKARTEEIKTLDELLKLQKQEGYVLILSDRSTVYLSDKKFNNCDFYIEVYDAYRE